MYNQDHTYDSSFLTIQNLSAWYQKSAHVLDQFSISLSEHEIVGLIGLNGAGKTTFLNTLSGLHASFKTDSTMFQGSNISFRQESFKINRLFVPAESHAFGYLTFQEYFTFVQSAYKSKCSLSSDRVTSLIQGFHFEQYVGTLLSDLSTGNLKKAYLITAFAIHPKLLLLDEPVNGLDFQSTEFLYQLINEYRQFGTLLFSSHILESICLTADRVLVLSAGHITRCFEDDAINAEQIREVLHEGVL